MTSKEIRQAFFDFFRERQHHIESSAPIVRKNDPTLMFTNSGMAPFKDYFLGNQEAPYPRIADTQKCLRVSGKHNDLEEVGRDSYHHTMFEMLGNWSFGDYFKEEAIQWAWQLLTEVYQLPKDRLYVTLFEGNAAEGVDRDREAENIWQKYLDKERILAFDKKDNFWEMGETGPCGPCTEIHIDLRDDLERAQIPGKDLVNRDHPQVVEIWNLVFMQYNRLENQQLVPLPQKHVDTGMGFERLCMAIQGKKSNYDTDVFQHYLAFLEGKTGKKYQGTYTEDNKVDIAFRVLVDHIRAVAFTIADGQLPDSTGAGYVVRRILRRAVRYYFSFLDVKEPLLYQMVPLLAKDFEEIFPELAAQQELVGKVILEEEKSFLRTLEEGLKRMDLLLKENAEILDGKTVFELYDTFGFPIDLTRLIALENGLSIDEEGFEKALLEQKERSRKDAQKSVGDWMQVKASNTVEFVGYDTLSLAHTEVTKYRKIKAKGKELYQLVLESTPFYAESGGQVGDTGWLTWENGQSLEVLDTQRENELIVHLLTQLPDSLEGKVKAEVNSERRKDIQNNHSATHLLHAALREILGTHVHQKGSLVEKEYLRFDFSHFQKVTEEELKAIEQRVNEKIRANIPLEESRDLPLEVARERGAMMLFGEKYGEKVRMITFGQDYSVELCGGCHVPATGHIGFFKITSESAVAAGVRRIEALTGSAAEHYLREELETLQGLRKMLKNPKDLLTALQQIQDQNKQLEKQIEALQSRQAGQLKQSLLERFQTQNGAHTLFELLPLDDAKAVKNLLFEMQQSHPHSIIGVGFVEKEKPQLMLLIAQSLVESQGWDAGKIIRNAAQKIKGGGGGQKFFASAGGSDAQGLAAALQSMEQAIKTQL
jgi:alanyl-tRNA synthetase